MKLASKFTLTLLAGMCFVLTLYAYIRVQGEITLFESDMQRDHATMGEALGLAIAKIWQVSGDDALAFVEHANRERNNLSVRWVWLDSSSDERYRPRVAMEVLDPVRQGRIANYRVKEGVGAGVLYTFVPVKTGGTRLGALELGESLAEERNAIRLAVWRNVIKVTALAAMSGLLAMFLGVALVGRPIRSLIEKARRVGAGDLSGPLHLSQSDEFGELATELNAMCDRLGEANKRVESETAARIATIEQLRHADRLTTIGRLASGIAHELGTPLNVVLVRAKMISSGEVRGEEASANARVICEQSERMTRIIRQLLDFARLRQPVKAPVDLCQVVRQTLLLLGPFAERKRVEMGVEGDDEPITLEVDANLLQQVLSNLIMNGLQAMPSGGRLVVSLSRSVASPADRPDSELPCVRISVIDQGEGVSEQNMPHIFEPFFTTKDVGEGTGLGLSVSAGIVQEHGGWIDVKSAPRHGSCFSVYLPERAA